jgi:hypothetical protein
VVNDPFLKITIVVATPKLDGLHTKGKL